MFGQLREFYDPQYRLELLKQKMRASFRNLWGRHADKLELKWRRMYEVIDIFAHIDLDGNGRLDESEIAATFKRYDIVCHHMDVDNLLHLCDEGGDGEVDIAEFLKWYSNEADFDLHSRRNLPTDALSDKALLIRDALRFDERVRGMIDEFWDILNYEAEVACIHAQRFHACIGPHPQHHPHTYTPTTQDENEAYASKDEYIEFNLHLQRHVLIDLHSELPADFDEDAATVVAEQEWEFDSQGKPHMDKETFTLSMFQLVDAWSDETSAKAYNHFLDELLQMTTVVREDEVRTRPYIFMHVRVHRGKHMCIQKLAHAHRMGS